MSETSGKSTNISLLYRLLIIFYDSLLLFAVLFFASIPIVVPFKIVYGSPWYFVYVLYIYVVGFIYFGWFWTHGGKTLAMKTWKAKLISDSVEISWRQALIRYLSALLSWFCLGLGFIWSLFRKDKATWHDLLSGTRLVRLDPSKQKQGNHQEK